MPATATAEKVDKIKVTEGPNKGAVLYSNQRYMIDEHNVLLPYNRKVMEDRDKDGKRRWDHRPYDPFVQGVPGFVTHNPLDSMTRDELLHYVEVKHPKSVKLYPDMPRNEMLSAIRLREQQLVDMGRDPANRFPDMDDD